MGQRNSPEPRFISIAEENNLGTGISVEGSGMSRPDTQTQHRDLR
jgi:hypothetical protein